MNKEAVSQKNGQNGRKVFKCFTCGESGHTAKHCMADDKALYLGDLPPSYEEEDIKALLKPHGEVRSLKVGTSVDGGKWAFVNMTTVAEAEKAVQELNCFEVKGREITVKLKNQGMWKCPDPTCNRRNFDDNLLCIECDFPKAKLCYFK